MAKTQIDDVLTFDDNAVFGRGPLVRETDPRETWKSLWVRVCQRDHATREPRIAEGSQHGESPDVFDDANQMWKLRLEQTTPGALEEGDASVSAVLVYEAGGDLFTLAWAECVHLTPASGGSHPEHGSSHHEHRGSHPER